LPRTTLGDRVGRVARLALVPVIGLALMACGQQANNNNPTGDGAFPNLVGADGFPHQVVTSQGAAAASLYMPVFIIAVIIFVLVEGLLLLAVLRFRHRGKDGELPAQVHGNNRLEIVWTAIPLVIVLVLFAASTLVLARVEDKTEKPAVVLDVLAFRFGWTFTYKQPGTFDAQTGMYQDAGVTISSTPASPSSDQPRDPAQDVVVPVGEPILFRLNAADVIHSFYVPSFFFKRDAIPGRTNEFEITIEKPGRYGGQCAEFCGLNHSQMYFDIRAVEPAEYEAWLAKTAAGGPTPADQASPAAGQASPAAGTSEARPPATAQASPAAGNAAASPSATAQASPAAGSLDVTASSASLREVD
jgi:cytochrome c oxidase subunit II